MPKSKTRKQSLMPKSKKSAKKVIKKTNRMVRKEKVKAKARRAIGSSAKLFQKLSKLIFSASASPTPRQKQLKKNEKARAKYMTNPTKKYNPFKGKWY